MKITQVLLWLVLSTAIFSTAYATKPMPVPPSKNENHQKQYQEAKSSAKSSSTSASESSATSSTVGGNQSIEFSSPADVKIRNVVSPNPPNSYPTAPCRISKVGGLSLPGGSLSGGASSEDRECTLRETARSFNALGVPEMGLYLLCQNSVVINGRHNKKGVLDKGENPIGAELCFELVRQYQSDADSGEQVFDELHERQLLLEEELRMYRGECAESVDRSFKACQKGK